jgi:hypothetical protein
MAECRPIDSNYQVTSTEPDVQIRVRRQGRLLTRLKSRPASVDVSRPDLMSVDRIIGPHGARGFDGQHVVDHAGADVAIPIECGVRERRVADLNERRCGIIILACG